ncbi:MAG: hypothetical protein M3O70_06920, partial [Actinomycetota bacterium]|nr:hypothetical protein [Actinomycetota bacterium]
GWGRCGKGRRPGWVASYKTATKAGGTHQVLALRGTLIAGAGRYVARREFDAARRLRGSQDR